MAYFRAAIGGGGQIVEGNLAKQAANQTITLGFKPKKLYIYDKTTSGSVSLIYDEDASTTKYLRAVAGSGSQSGVGWANITTSSTVYTLHSITSTGFTFRGSSAYAFNYVAVR